MPEGVERRENVGAANVCLSCFTVFLADVCPCCALKGSLHQRVLKIAARLDRLEELAG